MHERWVDAVGAVRGARCLSSIRHTRHLKRAAISLGCLTLQYLQAYAMPLHALPGPERVTTIDEQRWPHSLAIS